MAIVILRHSATERFGFWLDIKPVCSHLRHFNNIYLNFFLPFTKTLVCLTLNKHRTHKSPSCDGIMQHGDLSIYESVYKYYIITEVLSTYSWKSLLEFGLYFNLSYTSLKFNTVSVTTPLSENSTSHTAVSNDGVNYCLPFVPQM